MVADQIYLETLLLYFEEEVEGEAYFQELAKAFKAPEHKEKLTLLANVERHAAEGVLPLVTKYGLRPRSREDLARTGRADARRTRPDWTRLVAGMNETYPGYLKSFHKLEEMAPPEDRDRLSFLTQHEVAAIEFLKLEDQDLSQSVAPLRAYLSVDPASWVANVI